MRRSKPPEGNYQQQQFFAKDKEDGGYARADVPVLALQCYKLEGCQLSLMCQLRVAGRSTAEHSSLRSWRSLLFSPLMALAPELSQNAASTPALRGRVRRSSTSSTGGSSIPEALWLSSLGKWNILFVVFCMQ